MKVYALYKGDQYLGEGTVKELALKYNLSYKSLYCSKTPSRIKKQAKQKKSSKAYIIVDLEE